MDHFWDKDFLKKSFTIKNVKIDEENEKIYFRKKDSIVNVGILLEDLFQS